MTIPVVFRSICLLAAALAAACSPASTPAPTTAPVEATPTARPAVTPVPPTATPLLLPSETPAPPPPLPTVTVSGRAEALVAAAIDDLSRRAAVSPEAIRLLEVSPQTWPDASLGCPEPGRLYAQVIVEGYRIVLEAEARAYAYHTSQAEVVYCPQDQP